MSAKGDWGTERDGAGLMSNAPEPCAYSPGPNPEWVVLLPGAPVTLELRSEWAAQLT